LSMDSRNRSVLVVYILNHNRLFEGIKIHTAAE